MSQIELFTERLRTEKPDIYHETTENSITVKHTIGELTLEFYLTYRVLVKHYISPTYENPEECEFGFENVGHSEIALYKGSEFIELSDKELHIIHCILTEHLY